jgi:hypothetical protein
VQRLAGKGGDAEGVGGGTVRHGRMLGDRRPAAARLCVDSAGGGRLWQLGPLVTDVGPAPSFRAQTACTAAENQS